MSTYDSATSSQTEKSPADLTKAVEPSGYKGENPATAGPGQTKVTTDTPEKKEGHLNPSAPEDSNATPGSLSSK